MGRLSLGEIVVLVLVALLLFGSKNLPKIGRSIGEALKEFKKTMKDDGAGEEDNKPT
ncbi:MAG: twin-arginine translocase TatA/TatE family subunit [Candidatus Omnitrophota bacterium]